MLESLFGNSVIEKVLFFLVANRKCYPTQLKRAFQTPLYSFQNALRRLEKGGIVVSHQEGKTLLYELNPRYLFLKELEAFVLKAYTTLPDEIKMKYYEPVIRKRPRRQGKPL